MNLLAKIVSVLFHPLLMATYMCAILMVTMPVALDPLRREAFMGFLIVIFLITFLLPAINIAIFRLFGSITSFSMRDRRERIIPFYFIAVLYLGMTLLFYWKFNMNLTDNVLKFLLIMNTLVIVSAIITPFYRISIHSVGMCGLLGVLLPLNTVSEDGALLYPTVFLIVLAGVVMSSRLQLNAHTPREVMLGGMMGFAISFGGMLVLF